MLSWDIVRVIFLKCIANITSVYMMMVSVSTSITETYPIDDTVTRCMLITSFGYEHNIVPNKHDSHNCRTNTIVILLLYECNDLILILISFFSLQRMTVLYSF